MAPLTGFWNPEKTVHICTRPADPRFRLPVCRGGGPLGCWGWNCIVPTGVLWPEAPPLCILFLMSVSGREELRHWKPGAAGHQDGIGGVARRNEDTLPSLDGPQKSQIHLDGSEPELYTGLIVPLLYSFQLHPLLQTKRPQSSCCNMYSVFMVSRWMWYQIRVLISHLCSGGSSVIC